MMLSSDEQFNGGSRLTPAQKKRRTMRRERFERAATVRAFWTPAMLQAEKERLDREIAEFLARRKDGEREAA